jgi:aryl-alcohol dehydrogenase-like predicted oxidoreductase
MEMRKLGSAGPAISVIGFGAWEAGGDMWGPNESEEQVVEAIEAAIDSGMTWIDTAEVYGDGRSEELVGRAIAGRDDGVLIFTKVGPKENGGGGSGVRPDQIHGAVRRSLERLGVEQLDLYQIHWPDETGVPIEESWGAMAEVQDAGFTRHIGLSNFGRSDVERCEAIRHVDSIQNQFSLVRPNDRADLLPWLRDHGIGYLAYAPLGYGILTGAITMESTFHEGDWRSGSFPGMGGYERIFRPEARGRWLAKVEQMRPIAERLSTSAATLALRWVIEQSPNVVAIAGSRNALHVKTNAETGDLRLDQATLRELDEIFS